MTLGGVPQNGFTPLYLAARCGLLAVAQMLLEAGANPVAKDKVRGGGEGGR